MPGKLLECRRSHVGLCPGAHNVRYGAPFVDHVPGIGRAGSPYRSLKHGRKKWMFRDIGVPEWLFEIDQAPSSDITGAVLSIYKDYKTGKVKAQKAMDVVKSRQKETMAIVKKLAKV